MRILSGDEKNCPVIIKGQKGDKGDAATITIGTVTTVDPYDPAEVTNVGDENDAILNFKLPMGVPGDTGNAATIAVGTVTRLSPDADPTVENVGNEHDAILNFGIPADGGGGTSDYTDLTNKPKINNVTLTGEKSGGDLGLIDAPVSPDSGDVLTWDGAKWIAAAPPAGAFVVDLVKYGITQADYTEPFTEANYNVAHANGVGLQTAIDDAKAAGATTVVVPAGNYPLCYESDADTTYNPILDATGIDLWGEGAKLYVIYDEAGTNPYFTGGNPRELCGVMIVTDRDVHGFHLVGERAYRHRSDSAPWKDASKGIGLTKDTDGNRISNCLIELFSGDGIGNRSYMTQLAGWSDADAVFTSIDYDDANETWVPDAYHFTSARHGAYWIDQTQPMLIRNSTYYMYSTAPLRILCFDEDEKHLGDIKVWQGEYFYFLPGTYYWYIQLTREIAHDPSTTESWVHFIGVGKYQRTTVEGCEIRLNQRGGLSNLPNATVIKNCLVHNNAGAYGDMWAYYDSTQFGVDIEDIYIHDITIQDCVFNGNMSAVLYRCWGINLIDCVFYGNVNSLNFCGDFFAKNTLFASNCSLTGSIPHGKKVAIGCRFHGTKASEIEVLETSGLVPETRTVNGYALNSNVSLNANDVGAIPLPSAPTSGQVLTWNGSAWVAQSLPVYDGS